MSHRTPWVQSSLLSDRVKPQKRPANPPKNKGKGKEEQEAPKSDVVRGLENTIKKLQSEPGDQKDAKGGCFCLARMHELSPYCPLCSRCGLILCSINAPYYACPHCSALLLSPTSKAHLLDRLRAELSETLAKEEKEVEHLREEARQAVGAFPSLNGSNANQQERVQQAQSHKVLSLNSKTKRVTVASYSPAPAPAPVSLAHLVQARDTSPERIRAPPLPEIAIARGPLNAARPWADTRGDGFVRSLTYVRDPRADRDQLKAERKARKAERKNDVGEYAGVGSGPTTTVGSSTNL